MATAATPTAASAAPGPVPPPTLRPALPLNEEESFHEATTTTEESPEDDDDVTTRWIDALLSEAESSLASAESRLASARRRRARRSGGTGDGGDDDDDVGGGGGGSVPPEDDRPAAGSASAAEPDPTTTASHHRLALLGAQADALLLASDCASWASAHSLRIPPSSLRREVERCLGLGAVLCKHDPPLVSDEGPNPLGPTSVDRPRRIYDEMLSEYVELRRYVKARTTSALRASLRRVGYPSRKGCESVSELFESRFVVGRRRGGRDDGGGEEEPDDGDGGDDAASCLVHLARLQAVRERVSDHVRRHRDRCSGCSVEVLEDLLPPAGREEEEDEDDGSERRSDAPRRRRRIDALDELVRPIAERVLYHFLDGDKDELSSRIDRLPEWLFKYARDVVSDGPYDLVVDWLRPSLLLRDDLFGDDDDDEAAAIPVDVAPSWDGPSYFLTEMVLLVGHVLAAKDFFRCPIVAGPESNPRALCDAIEQTLLFDSFVRDLLGPSAASSDDDAGGGGVRGDAADADAGGFRSPPPRLVDAFVSSDPELLDWWIRTEGRYAASTLRESSEKSAEEEDDADAGGAARRGNDVATMPARSIFSAEAETFVALLRSTRWKSNAIGDDRARTRFVSKVLVPLCMQFMDAVHSAATELRTLLCQRRRDTTSGLIADDDLEKNVENWIDVIGGAHVAAVSVLGFPPDDDVDDRTEERGGGDVRNAASGAARNAAAAPPPDRDLDRVGRSLQRLRDATIDEFGSAFAETIVTERAKLATYLMRCPHLLSRPRGGGGGGGNGATGEEEDDDARDGRSDDDDGAGTSRRGGHHPSPDLDEPVHVSSVVVRVCDAAIARASSSSSTERAPRSAPAASAPAEGVARYAPRSMIAEVAGRIAEKFLEVALDAHGTVPDVGLGGAREFRRDARVVAEIFDGDDGMPPPRRHRRRRHPSFRRLIDVVDLMAMEPNRFGAFREALIGLVVRGDEGEETATMEFDDDDDFGADRFLSYDDFASDGTVLDEAHSMIRAKGFGSLELEDVVSIMNRRRA